MVVAAADMFIYLCFLMSTCIMWGGIDVAMCPTADVHAEVRRPAGRLLDDMLNFQLHWIRLAWVPLDSP